MSSIVTLWQEVCKCGFRRAAKSPLPLKPDQHSIALQIGGEEVMQHLLTACYNPIFSNRCTMQTVAGYLWCFLIECVAFGVNATCHLTFMWHGYSPERLYCFVWVGDWVGGLKLLLDCFFTLLLRLTSPCRFFDYAILDCAQNGSLKCFTLHKYFHIENALEKTNITCTDQGVISPTSSKFYFFRS